MLVTDDTAYDKSSGGIGVSAFDKSAVWFHFKASLRGMVIGAAVLALMIGVKHLCRRYMKGRSNHDDE